VASASSARSSRSTMMVARPACHQRSRSRGSRSHAARARRPGAVLRARFLRAAHEQPRVHLAAAVGNGSHIAPSARCPAPLTARAAVGSACVGRTRPTFAPRCRRPLPRAPARFSRPSGSARRCPTRPRSRFGRTPNGRWGPGGPLPARACAARRVRARQVAALADRLEDELKPKASSSLLPARARASRR
jgi:hypothetical protein